MDKPRTFTLEELQRLAPLEERIYRHRCVEAWSIVVPWIGYSFNVLLKEVSPQPKAKFVAFESYYSPGQMPLGSHAGIQLPYIEGLAAGRSDAPAGAALLRHVRGNAAQSGWRAGAHGVAVEVRVQEHQVAGEDQAGGKDSRPPLGILPKPNEYGFYSNVNPNVDHPRWSQAKERRLGEFFRRPTLMFNGYDQVASLYAGMDLKKNF